MVKGIKRLQKQIDTATAIITDEPLRKQVVEAVIQVLQTKKSNDPKKPKKATAYSLFVTDYMAVNKDNKEIANFTKAGEAWKKLTADKKLQWTDKANKFNKELIAKYPELAVKEIPKPKHAPIGYRLFIVDTGTKLRSQLKKGEEKSNKEINASARMMWKDLTEDAKKLWNDKAKTPIVEVPAPAPTPAPVPAPTPAPKKEAKKAVEKPKSVPKPKKEAKKPIVIEDDEIEDEEIAEEI